MKIKGILLFGTIFSLSLSAYGDGLISINKKAEYHDEELIASNIVKECNNLGYQFSSSTKKFLGKHGFASSLDPELNIQSDGYSLKLTILNAYSGRYFSGGHQKSVSIGAELYKNGELIDNFKTTRNSNGGLFYKFKSSCSVLERCVNTLGNDVAKWISRNHKI
ncbi:hypothetical protein BTJ40_00480 [Microbulbifer sp. A4B17]|uniref:hypothetical protein n=1 Tax=Microbulbifer sp. A4B17 TaxID=359370 RepID=UPI000D52D598|nr:hypothetical protein [Microbulbifer sp. A4B17]AWF79424.1 hypothetical protein BTJ40_00480 [Microbulbifer sp. A4B17]